ncbi:MULTISPECIES: FAD-dependent monooxygenase [unclassified Streptomyces]|uniref:FAD-dependent monooxygenase n=1 Tax=unclassified Streptomyces TaxID=2593676 RepID=UPI0027E421F8|nr:MULTISPECIES: FAD-dependent monooxygenase [unclassified Streptomyces]MCH0566881.1 FAD-dependent monooxygenase [Streptomyces sp. MUM 2J]MCH0569822.1 FAD-dependent monooxygenase [Streptomyces sp. MUM 136J]
MSRYETDVLIVGGGPVGMALALDLRSRGVDCVLAEATDGSVAHSKVSTIGPRSMELFRLWGIAPRIRTAGWPDDHLLDVTWATQVGGHEVLRVSRGTAGDRPPSAHSPEHERICPAHWLNPLLMEALGTHPDGPLWIHHRVREWTQTDDHVSVMVDDLARGTTHTVRTRYLIACDGASSPVRKACGIDAPDRYAPQVFRNILFRAPRLRADLEARGHRPAMVHFLLIPPAMRYPMRALDGDGLYNLVVGGEEASGNAESAPDLLARAIAFPTPVEIVSDGKWYLTQRVADRYRAGRVFLAGDAAHTLSPSGGFGLNTGIADAADLGWKLDAELAGWAGPGLLDSYDIERRPIALRNLEEANTNLTRTARRELPAELDAETPVGRRARATLAEAMEREGAAREFDAPDVHLSFRYRSPLIAKETRDDASRWPEAAAPGRRAPHVWLGPQTSTLDLFGTGFRLLALGRADGREKIERAFVDRGVPFSTTTLEHPEATEAYGSRLVLVRPDGHVAWRGDAPPSSPENLADLVRGAVHP